jgi:hypothetical protein
VPCDSAKKDSPYTRFDLLLGKVFQGSYRNAQCWLALVPTPRTVVLGLVWCGQRRSANLPWLKVVLQTRVHAVLLVLGALMTVFGMLGD